MMSNKCTSPKRTGPEMLRFEAWKLDLNRGTSAQQTLSDRMRLYAEGWEFVLNAHASLTEKVERLVTGGKKFSASIHYDNSPDDGYAIVDPQDWAEFAALLESEQDDPTAPDPAD